MSNNFFKISFIFLSTEKAIFFFKKILPVNNTAGITVPSMTKSPLTVQIHPQKIEANEEY